MCAGCPDFVDYCSEGNCYNPEGGSHGKYKMFYLMDHFCEHLTERYGTHRAAVYDHVYYWHDPEDYEGKDATICDDDCIRKGWYDREDIERVMRKVFGGDGPQL